MGLRKKLEEKGWSGSGSLTLRPASRSEGGLYDCTIPHRQEQNIAWKGSCATLLCDTTVPSLPLNLILSRPCSCQYVRTRESIAIPSL